MASEVYRYWVLYGPTHAHSWSRRKFIERKTPLDTEDAILEEEANLPKNMGSLIIKDWKRIN